MKDDCGPDTTRTAGNFIVEENNAKFGFDLVENIPLFSPFQLKKMDAVQICTKYSVQILQERV